MAHAGGRPKKYTPASLAKAVDKYFLSRGCTSPVLDDEGNTVTTDEGVPLTRTVYPIGISLEDLECELDISHDTWANYCKDPQFSETTTRVKQEMKNYLIREVLTREGKDVKGPQFILQCGYGMNPQTKTEVELGPRATAATAAASLPLAEKLDLLKKLTGRMSDE